MRMSKKTNVTGHDVSTRDIDDAVAAIERSMAGPKRRALPPDLAVQMLNIHRCLRELRAIRRLLKT